MVKPSGSSLEVTAGMLLLLQLHQALTFRGNLSLRLGSSGRILFNFNIRITNDDREVEMEQNMQGVGSILGTLKDMATDMGDEIERQNKHLDLIQGKVRRGLLAIFYVDGRGCHLVLQRNSWYHIAPFSFFDVMIQIIR